MEGDSMKCKKCGRKKCKGKDETKEAFMVTNLVNELFNKLELTLPQGLIVSESLNRQMEICVEEWNNHHADKKLKVDKKFLEQCKDMVKEQFEKNKYRDTYKRHLEMVQEHEENENKKPSYVS